MDPITVGFFLVASIFVVALMIFMFKSFGKETDFEEVYGRNALRLLAEEKSSKTKSSKINKKNKATVDRKKEANLEKEIVKHERKVKEAPSLMTQEIPVLEDVKQSTSEGKQQKKKGKKHVTDEAQRQQESLEPIHNEKDVVTEAPEKKLLLSEQTEEETFEPVIAKVAEKKAKKKKPQKLEELEPQTTTVYDEESVLEDEVLLQSAVKKTEQTKLPKSKVHTGQNGINEEAFLSRVKEVEGLEPEYIAFVVKHFADSSAQRKKLNEELGMLKKQCADREKLVAQCTEKLGILGKKDSEIEKLRRINEEEKKKFEEEKANYSMFEQTVRNQLAQSVQDRKQMQQALDKHLGEIEKLKQELVKASNAAHASPSLDVVKQADMLRNEVNSFKNVVQQRESELKQKNQIIEQLIGETKEQQRKIELLNQSNSLAGQRAQDLETQAENARRSFEEKLQHADQKASELQIVMKDKSESMERMIGEARHRATEFERQIRVLENSVKEGEMERQRLINENLRYKAEVSSLEEAYKANLDKMAQEMKDLKHHNEENKTMISLKLNDASEKIASLTEANKKLEDASSKFKKEAAAAKEREDFVTAQLNEETKKYEAMKAAKEAKESTVRCAHCAKSITSLNEDAILNSKLQLASYRKSSSFSKPLLANYEDNEEEKSFIRQNPPQSFNIIWYVDESDTSNIPNEVYITGSFWDWQSPKIMERSEHGFSFRIDFPPKPVNSLVQVDSSKQVVCRRKAYTFKFVVDGVWRCSDRYSKITENGHENNVIYI